MAIQTKPHRREMLEAKAEVAVHYDSGVRASIVNGSVEQAVRNGYALLHGMQMGKDERIALLRALVVLERAGDYNPQDFEPEI